MIQMQGVVKRFGAQLVLSGVTFTAQDHEVFGLLGPSGAGKTTIINILTHQLDCDAGEHHIGVTSQETGVMLEQDGLFTRLTCLDNLELFATIFALPRTRPMEVLASVGLDQAARKPVSALSKGMRQRLALARAVLNHPKVLFLDEPTSGLDPLTARGIHRLVQDLRDDGSTIFLTTHNMDEAVKLCDHVILLNKGTIVEQGTPLDICRRHDAMKTVPDLEAVFIEMTGDPLE